MCKFAIFFLSIHLFIPCNFFLFCVCFTCNNNNNNNNKFMTYSVTTLQECGHLRVPGVQLTVILFDWSDKNCCYEKWGKTDNLFIWWLKTWLTIISSLVLVLICYSPLVIRPQSQAPQAHDWESLFRKRNIISCQRQNQNSLKSPWHGQNC